MKTYKKIMLAYRWNWNWKTFAGQYGSLIKMTSNSFVMMACTIIAIPIYIAACIGFPFYFAFIEPIVLGVKMGDTMADNVNRILKQVP